MSGQNRQWSAGGQRSRAARRYLLLPISRGAGSEKRETEDDSRTDSCHVSDCGLASWQPILVELKSDRLPRARRPEFPLSANDDVDFDPYHKWLGIPRGQRPVTYYQLLGIASTERDPEVIEDAAIRQSSHVRTYQIGTHAEICQRVLNEIAQARQTILNAEKRKEYDAKLPEAVKARPKIATAERAMKPKAPAPARSNKGMIASSFSATAPVAALAAVAGRFVWMSQPEPKKSPSRGDLAATSEKKSPPAVQPSRPKTTDPPPIELKPKIPVVVETPVVKESPPRKASRRRTRTSSSSSNRKRNRRQHRKPSPRPNRKHLRRIRRRIFPNRSSLLLQWSPVRPRPTPKRLPAR